MSQEPGSGQGNKHLDAYSSLQKPPWEASADGESQEPDIIKNHIVEPYYAIKGESQEP